MQVGLGWTDGGHDPGRDVGRPERPLVEHPHREQPVGQENGDETSQSADEQAGRSVVPAWQPAIQPGSRPASRVGPWLGHQSVPGVGEDLRAGIGLNDGETITHAGSHH